MIFVQMEFVRVSWCKLFISTGRCCPGWCMSLGRAAQCWMVPACALHSPIHSVRTSLQMDGWKPNQSWRVSLKPLHHYKHIYDAKTLWFIFLKTWVASELWCPTSYPCPLILFTPYDCYRWRLAWWISCLFCLVHVCEEKHDLYCYTLTKTEEWLCAGQWVWPCRRLSTPLLRQNRIQRCQPYRKVLKEAVQLQ